MRPSTVDLLRIRDGEPVDADVRAAVNADPRQRAELERLVATRQALRDLPTIDPPADLWPRVAARLALNTDARTIRPRYWPAGAAIAAGVALIALWVVGRAPDAPEPNTDVPATIVAGQASQSRPLLGTPAYASLVEESARLERALDALRYQPRVVRAGTAATISDLEDQIGWIDEYLMFGRAGLSPAETRLLYRQRVELLKALYQVRYAQAQPFGF